ncbi:MAG: ABC transporter ATP-binding protein [Candidatus Electryoneaceae bacterium]|nr:ABC transporter ATP-binding protein [Candidatus Electryoneaceae bacterium]
MNQPEYIVAERIGYRYLGKSYSAIEDVNCVLHTGEIVGLMGLSGSGKSTLGRLFKGVIEPTNGSFRFGYDDDQSSIATSDLRMRMIGWTSAHPEVQLFADTVWDEVAFGPSNLGLTGSDLDDRVFWGLDMVGLASEGDVERHPYSLSGGQRRRVALAGVVVMQCRFYIFDEPTAGLDRDGLDHFFRLLRLLREDGCGVIWITHEVDLLQEIVDRKWLMDEGRLMVQDNPVHNGIIEAFIERYG